MELDHILIESFFIETITGYGNMTPTTPGGKAFAVCFALLGIPLFILASSDLGARLSTAVGKTSRKLADLITSKMRLEDEEKCDQIRSALASLIVITIGKLLTCSLT